MWYLYAHKNKANNKYYIGKTQNLNDRWANNGYKYKTCPRFWSAICSYGWDNFEHIVLLENVPDEIIDEKEKEYIQRYNSLYPNGYNLNSGGTGGNAWAGKTDAEKEKYAQERREETLSRGEEWHKKLSEGQKKRWANMSEEDRKKRSEQYKGANNGCAKKCRCVETGIIYGSYADAAEAVGGDRRSGSKIGECIRGKRKTFKGFHWEVAENE